MSDQLDPILHQAEQSRLKQQLAWRLGIAAALIVIVLAAIWFMDHVQQNNDTPQITTTPQIAPIASAIAERASVPATASAVAASASISAASEPAVASETATASTPSPTPAEARTKPAATGQIVSSRSTAIPTAPPAAVPAIAPATETATRKPTPTTPALVKPTDAPLSLPAAEKIVEAAPASAGAPGKFEVHAGTNGYTVQAGVFMHASNADKLLTQLQNAGVPAWLETRVQIGPFKNKADAEAAIRKLRKLGIEPVVRENQ